MKTSCTSEADAPPRHIPWLLHSTHPPPTPPSHSPLPNCAQAISPQTSPILLLSLSRGLYHTVDAPSLLYQPCTYPTRPRSLLPMYRQCASRQFAAATCFPGETNRPESTQESTTANVHKSLVDPVQKKKKNTHTHTPRMPDRTKAAHLPSPCICRPVAHSKPQEESNG